MQQPTCTNLKIRSSRDAHKIFYAVRQGVLQLVTRRLDTEERQALRSGCVYAWEERGPSTEVTGLGIERFTEGRRWSPSRVRDEFLFYYEKWTAPTVEMGQPGGSDQRGEPPEGWHPLVKQTYSVYIETPKGRRKWHLTAYFTQPTVDGLGTIDELPDVVNVEVPEDMFSSTRATTRVPRSSRTDGESRTGAPPRAAGQNPTRTYAAYPVFESEVSYTQTQQTPQLADTRTHGYSVRSPTDSSYEAQYTPRNTYDQRSRWYTPTPMSPASGAWHGSPSPSMVNPLSSTRAYGACSQTTLAHEQPAALAADTPVTRHALSFSLSSTHDSSPARSIHPRESSDRSYNHHYTSLDHLSHPRSSLRHRPSSWSQPTLALHDRPESISRSGGTRSEGSGGSSPRSPQSEGGRAERDSSPALVPLRSLLRNHPYRRDPMDDRLLRKLDPRTSTA